MADKIKIFCDYCGFETYKERKEVNRKLKNNPQAKFYCSNICSGYAQGKKIDIQEKMCPCCKQKFKCNIAKERENRTFCSRECASAGSVTEARRNNPGQKLKHNADITAASLRSRESWKYEELKKYLDENKINYQFEYVIKNSIFDLALIDKKILIEFDGPYHQSLESDFIKTELAKEFGWNLIRIQTKANEIISIQSNHLLENLINGK